MRIETLAIHAGRQVDPVTGAVVMPIYPSATYERASDGGYPTGFSYSRDGNPNRKALETCLGALEGDKDALVFSSGMAVVNAIFQGLEPGDHILAPEDVYYVLRRLLAEIFPKAGFEIDYVDMTDPARVQPAVRPNTRLIWLETPSNPLLRITDLAAIAQIARGSKAITVCDGTFATPILQRPLELGVDMVMHSTTKYISGHSDVVGGVLVTRHDNYLFERVRKAQHVAGAVPSPFDCWLSLRGIETLPWRVRGQQQNARTLAEFLRGHPQVEHVHYPGFPDHPGHEVAARQMSGFGAMISVQVRGEKKEAMAAAARLKVFTRATSLGGTHSLVEHRASIEGLKTTTPQNLLRLSVGLEHVDDLIADFDQALRSGESS